MKLKNLEGGKGREVMKMEDTARAEIRKRIFWQGMIPAIVLMAPEESACPKSKINPCL